MNKASVYRGLSEKFPERSPKAFERKFQNISALLYEQRLPYCKGLKPLHNYQRLLKLIVLDELDRTPLPAVEPHEILFSKLRDLSEAGPIKVNQEGSGRFGLAIEEALGIPQNSDKAADFMGIELKTKSDGTLQTLFSRTPTRYLDGADKNEMFGRHCYFDAKKNRKALYTSFSNVPDSLGFRLVPANEKIVVFRGDTLVLEYSAESLEEALLSKHSQTAYISLATKRVGDTESCSIKGARYCKWPSIIRFLKLVASGAVFLDFTMSEKPNGAVNDH